MRIVSVVGARPNFVKLAAVARALNMCSGVEHLVVHTGQHYDPLMSETFFEELEIPRPHCNLEVGSGTHAQQTAAVLQRFEPICESLSPDWVLVYGDVNSTVAATLAAVKLGVRVAHVEAGLRSYDRSMPEEHNRVVTDHMADLLLAPSRDAVANLLAEGIPANRVRFVGNVMIDTLVRLLPRAKAVNAAHALGFSRHEFAVVTLHRPSTVDDDVVLGEVRAALAAIAESLPVIFPVHPRSRRRLEGAHLGKVRVLEPLPYVEMLSLVETAAFVITDSGGVQEETTFLGVPCLTLRPNTERPITITEGTNRLVEPRYSALLSAVGEVSRQRKATSLEAWDGRAAERVAAALITPDRLPFTNEL